MLWRWALDSSGESCLNGYRMTAWRRLTRRGRPVQRVWADSPRGEFLDQLVAEVDRDRAVSHATDTLSKFRRRPADGEYVFRPQIPGRELLSRALVRMRSEVGASRPGSQSDEFTIAWLIVEGRKEDPDEVARLLGASREHVETCALRALRTLRDSWIRELRMVKMRAA